VALALMAAVCFAAGTVLQQKGAMSTTAGDGDAHFLVQILHEPVWIAGALTQAAGWIFQGAALDRGALVVVQAITTLSLVIALPLGVRFTGQRVGRRDVVAALGVVAGVVLFIVAGSPTESSSTPAAAVWWSASVLALLLIAGIAMLARGKHGATLAALFGTAAGVGFAFQAAVTKDFVGELGHGVGHLLATWSTYALIASALIGFVLQQSALKTGALAAAMASSNASTLVFSAVFGFVVFEERLTHGSGHLAFASIGLALAVIGVIELAAASSGATAGEAPATGAPALS
jgi:drug/metabolite transporter (DMT)-like permease